MGWEVKVGIGLAIFLGVLPFAIKQMPPWVAWPCLSLGVLIVLWAFVPVLKDAPIGPLVVFMVGIVMIAGSAGWYHVITSSKAAVRLAGDQPSIILLEPINRYSLTWDPPHDLQIITRPEGPSADLSKLSTRLPILRIKNLGRAVAHAVSIRWKFENPDFEAQVLSSARFARYSPRFSPGWFSISVGRPAGSLQWGERCLPEAEQKLPYLAPDIDNTSYVDLPIPTDVYNCAELLFTATLPDDAQQNVAATFEVLISWSDPPNGVVQKFRVTAIASSMKPTGTGIIKIPVDGRMRSPYEVMGLIRFQVGRL